MTEEKPTTSQPVDSQKRLSKRARNSIPILKIVLDTNQLFTGTASDLLQDSLRQVIESSRKHSDIQIEWYLPDMVRWEREFQMAEAAHNLLPALSKLERLLGHGLGINSEILE